MNSSLVCLVVSFVVRHHLSLTLFIVLDLVVEDISSHDCAHVCEAANGRSSVAYPLLFNNSLRSAGSGSFVLKI